MGEPYIGAYINHVSKYPNPKTAKHAIVPDIHSLNYPTCRLVVKNASGAKSTSEAKPEAFFEVKTFTAYKSLSNFNNTTTNPAN
eukprot:scaffold16162_cov71-Cyclotella_meneghiniana.AAC.22